MDAEYQRRLLPRLTSGGEGPASSEVPETGAGNGADTGTDTPPADGNVQRSGPGYRNYDYRGEIAPNSPVSGGVPPVQKAPGEQAPRPGGPSTTKRPFFVASSAPTPSSTSESTPVAVSGPDTGPKNIPAETAPFVPASAPVLTPAPDHGSEDPYWQYLAEEKAMVDRFQLNDEEYLYETYFH